MQTLASSSSTSSPVKKHPPGPSKAIAKSLNLRDIHTYTKLHEQYGDIFQLPLGKVPLIVTRDADHIRTVLGGQGVDLFPRPPHQLSCVRLLFGRAQIALDGKTHQDNKRMLSSWLFDDGHNASAFPGLKARAEELVDVIGRSCTGAGADISIPAELASVDINATISFGRSYGALASGKCAELDALKTCDRIFLARGMNKNYTETETPEESALFAKNKQLLVDRFTTELGLVRAKSDERYANALEHMIVENAKRTSSECPHGATPTEEEILGNLTGFLAGVGNSARLLSISFLMVARHRECQQLILEEMHRVVGNLREEDAKAAAAAGQCVAGEIGYDGIQKLDYLKCFMFECLRMYSPSVSAAPRYTADGAELGPYTFPSGSTLMMNFHGCHINAKHWSQPEEFQPMRFMEDGKARAVFPEGFFPFGYGGHSCIGKILALNTTMTAVATLVARYQSKPTPGHPETLFNTTTSEQILGFTEPINGAHLTVEERPPVSFQPAAHQKAVPTSKPAAVARAQVATVSGPLTMEEVAKHASEESCWLVIGGKVHDVTSFLAVHPGGPQILLKVGGKDATRMFRDIVRHTDFAEKETEKYCIGTLTSTSKL